MGTGDDSLRNLTWGGRRCLYLLQYCKVWLSADYSGSRYSKSTPNPWAI